MTDTHAFPTPRPTINADDPWQWLAAGWRDMRQAPVASLLYGVIAAIISVLLISALIGFDMGYLVLPLTATSSPVECWKPTSRRCKARCRPTRSRNAG